MTLQPETEFTPTKRQAAVIERAGHTAVDQIMQGKLEFPALKGLDRLRGWGIPSILIQQTIFETCVEIGTETQSFRPYTYKGDSASEFSPLMVRVIGDEEVTGYPPIEKEGDWVSGRPGFYAVGIYPPPESVNNGQ